MTTRTRDMLRMGDHGTGSSHGSSERISFGTGSTGSRTGSTASGSSSRFKRRLINAMNKSSLYSLAQQAESNVNWKLSIVALTIETLQWIALTINSQFRGDAVLFANDGVFGKIVYFFLLPFYDGSYVGGGVSIFSNYDSQFQDRMYGAQGGKLTNRNSNYVVERIRKAGDTSSFFVDPSDAAKSAHTNFILASCLFWLTVGLTLILLIGAVNALFSDHQQLSRRTRQFVAFVVHPVSTWLLMPVVGNLASFLVCDVSEQRLFWYPQYTCTEPLSVAYFVFGVIALVFVSLCAWLRNTMLIEDLVVSKSITASAHHNAAELYTLSKIVLTILFHVLSAKDFLLIYHCCVAAVAASLSFVYFLTLPYYREGMNRFLSSLLLAASGMAVAAAIIVSTAANGATNEGKLLSDSFWYSSTSVGPAIGLLLGTTAVFALAGAFLPSIRIDSGFLSGISQIKHGVILKDTVRRFPRGLPENDLLFSPHRGIEAALLQRVREEDEIIRSQMNRSGGQNMNTGTRHGGDAGGGDQRGAGGARRAARSGLNPTVAGDDEELLSQYSSVTATPSTGSTSARFMITLLRPLISRVVIASDVEVAGRVLAAYNDAVGHVPPETMIAYVSRIYTKGMAKFRRGSSVQLGMIHFHFTQLLLFYAGKQRAALTESEEIVRLCGNSFAAGYRANRLQIQLRNYLNHSDAAALKVLTSSLRMHKEILGHISLFWQKLLTQQNVDTIQLANIANMITTRRAQALEQFQRVLQNPTRRLLLYYARFLEQVMMDSRRAKIIRNKIDEETELRRQQQLNGGHRIQEQSLLGRRGDGTGAFWETSAVFGRGAGGSAAGLGSLMGSNGYGGALGLLEDADFVSDDLQLRARSTAPSSSGGASAGPGGAAGSPSTNSTLALRNLTTIMVTMFSLLVTVVIGFFLYEHFRREKMQTEVDRVAAASRQRAILPLAAFQTEQLRQCLMGTLLTVNALNNGVNVSNSGVFAGVTTLFPSDGEPSVVYSVDACSKENVGIWQQNIRDIGNEHYRIHQRLTTGNLAISYGPANRFFTGKRVEVLIPSLNGASLSGNVRREMTDLWSLGNDLATHFKTIAGFDMSALMDALTIAKPRVPKRTTTSGAAVPNPTPAPTTNSIPTSSFPSAASVDEAHRSMLFLVNNVPTNIVASYEVLIDLFEDEAHQSRAMLFWIVTGLFAVAEVIVFAVYALVLSNFQRIGIQKLSALSLFTLIPRRHLESLLDKSKERFENFDLHDGEGGGDDDNLVEQLVPQLSSGGRAVAATSQPQANGMGLVGTGEAAVDAFLTQTQEVRHISSSDPDANNGPTRGMPLSEENRAQLAERARQSAHIRNRRTHTIGGDGNDGDPDIPHSGGSRSGDESDGGSEYSDASGGATSDDLSDASVGDFTSEATTTDTEDDDAAQRREREKSRQFKKATLAAGDNAERKKRARKRVAQPPLLRSGARGKGSLAKYMRQIRRWLLGPFFTVAATLGAVVLCATLVGLLYSLDTVTKEVVRHQDSFIGWTDANNNWYDRFTKVRTATVLFLGSGSQDSLESYFYEWTDSKQNINTLYSQIIGYEDDPSALATLQTIRGLLDDILFRQIIAIWLASDAYGLSAIKHMHVLERLAASDRFLSYNMTLLRPTLDSVFTSYAVKQSLASASSPAVDRLLTRERKLLVARSLIFDDMYKKHWVRIEHLRRELAQQSGVGRDLEGVRRQHKQLFIATITIASATLLALLFLIMSNRKHSNWRASLPGVVGSALGAMAALVIIIISVTLFLEVERMIEVDEIKSAFTVAKNTTLTGIPATLFRARTFTEFGDKSAFHEYFNEKVNENYFSNYADILDQLAQVGATDVEIESVFSTVSLLRSRTERVMHFGDIAILLAAWSYYGVNSTGGRRGDGLITSADLSPVQRELFQATDISYNYAMELNAEKDTIQSQAPLSTLYTNNTYDASRSPEHQKILARHALGSTRFRRHWIGFKNNAIDLLDQSTGIINRISTARRAKVSALSSVSMYVAAALLMLTVICSMYSIYDILHSTFVVGDTRLGSTLGGMISSVTGIATVTGGGGGSGAKSRGPAAQSTSSDVSSPQQRKTDPVRQNSPSQLGSSALSTSGNVAVTGVLANGVSVGGSTAANASRFSFDAGAFGGSSKAVLLTEIAIRSRISLVLIAVVFAGLYAYDVVVLEALSSVPATINAAASRQSKLVSAGCVAQRVFNANRTAIDTPLSVDLAGRVRDINRARDRLYLGDEGSGSQWPSSRSVRHNTLLFGGVGSSTPFTSYLSTASKAASANSNYEQTTGIMPSSRDNSVRQATPLEKGNFNSVRYSHDCTPNIQNANAMLNLFSFSAGTFGAAVSAFPVAYSSIGRAAARVSALLNSDSSGGSVGTSTDADSDVWRALSVNGVEDIVSQLLLIYDALASAIDNIFINTATGGAQTTRALISNLRQRYEKAIAMVMSPLTSDLQSSTDMYTADAQTFAEALSTGHYCATAAVLALIILIFFFVLWPMLEMLAKEDDGTRLLLKMIPPQVRKEVPAVAEYLEYGTITQNIKLQRVAEISRELSTDCLVVINEHGIIEHVSTATLEEFGYRHAGEMIGKNVKIIMPEHIARRHDGYLQRYHRTGVRTIIDKRRRVTALRADDSTFVAEIIIKELVGGESSYSGRSGFFALIRNVTVEVKLENAQRLNEAVADMCTDPIVVIDHRGLITRCNSAAFSAFGFTPRELLMKNVSLLMPAVIGDHHDRYLANYQATGKSVNVIDKTREVIAIRKGGEKLVSQLTVKELRDESGATEGFIGFFRDLSVNFRIAQAALLNESIMQISPVPVVGFTATGEITRFNPSATDVLGFTREEIIGKNLSELMSDINSLDPHRADGGPSSLQAPNFPFYTATTISAPLADFTTTRIPSATSAAFQALIRSQQQQQQQHASSSGQSHQVVSASVFAAGNTNNIIPLPNVRARETVPTPATADVLNVSTPAVRQRTALPSPTSSYPGDEALLAFGFEGSGVPGFLGSSNINMVTTAHQRSYLHPIASRFVGHLRAQQHLHQLGSPMMTSSTSAFDAPLGGTKTNVHQFPVTAAGAKLQYLRASLKATTSAGSAAHFDPLQVVAITKSGLSLPVSVHLHDVAAADGSYEYVAFLRDDRDEITHRRSAHMSAVMYQSSPVALITADEDANILSCNAAAEKLVGYRKAQLVGSSAKMLMEPHVAERHDSFIARFKLNPSNKKIIGNRITINVRRGDNKIMPVEVMLRFVSQDSLMGKRRVFYLSMKDGTDSTRLQKATGLSEAIGALYTVPMVSITTSGNIVSYNVAAQDFFGHSEAEATGQNVKMLMPDEIAARHDHYLKSYLDTGRRSMINQRRVIQTKHKNGELRPAEILIQEVSRGAEGETLYVSYFKDLRKEMVLESYAAIASAIIDSSPLPIIIINSQGRVIRFSRAASEVFLWREEDIVGKNIKVLMPHDVAKVHDRYIRNYIETGVKRMIGSTRQVMAMRKDGMSINIEVAVKETRRSELLHDYSNQIRVSSVEIFASLDTRGSSGVLGGSGATPRSAGFSPYRGVGVAGPLGSEGMFGSVMGGAGGVSNIMELAGQLSTAGHHPSSGNGSSSSHHFLSSAGSAKSQEEDDLLFIGYVHDLSHEYILRQANELRDVILSESSIPIIQLDTEGRITFANPALAYEFDYTPEELVGNDATVLVPDLSGHNVPFLARFRPFVSGSGTGTASSLAASSYANQNNDVSSIGSGPSVGAGMYTFTEQNGSGETNFGASTATAAFGAIDFGGGSGFAPSVSFNMLSPNHPEYGYGGGGGVSAPSAVSFHHQNYQPQQQHIAGIGLGLFDDSGAGGGLAGSSNSNTARNDQNAAVTFAPIEAIARRRDGTEFPVEVHVREIVINKVKTYFSYLRNVQQLRLVKDEKLVGDTVVAHSATPLIIVSDEGIITEFNPAAEEVFGYTRREVIGYPVGVLQPPNPRARAGGSDRHKDSKNISGSGNPHNLTATEGAATSQEQGRSPSGGGGKGGGQEDGNECDDEDYTDAFFDFHFKASTAKKGREASETADGEIKDMTTTAKANPIMRELFVESLLRGLRIRRERQQKVRVQAQHTNEHQDAKGGGATPVCDAAQSAPATTQPTANPSSLPQRTTTTVAMIDEPPFNITRRINARRRDGTLFPVEMTLKEIRPPEELEGAPLVFVLYAKDLSHEESVVSAQALADAISTISQTPFVCVNKKGEITMFSRAAEEEFGYTADEVMGKDVSMLQLLATPPSSSSDVTHNNNNNNNNLDDERNPMHSLAGAYHKKKRRGGSKVIHDRQENTAPSTTYGGATINQYSLKALMRAVRGGPPIINTQGGVGAGGGGRWGEAREAHARLVGKRKNGTTFTMDVDIKHFDEDGVAAASSAGEDMASPLSMMSSARRGGGGDLPATTGTSPSSRFLNYAAAACLRNVTEEVEGIINSSAYSKIVELTGAPLVIIDERGIIETCNAALEEKYGYEPKELIGRNVKILMLPEVAAHHDAYLAKYLETGEKKVLDQHRRVYSVTKQQRIILSELFVHEMVTPQLKKRNFYGFLRDLTDQISLHQAFKLSDAITDLSPIPIIAIDPHGTILKFSAASSKLFEYEAGGEGEGSIVFGTTNVSILMRPQDAVAHDAFLSASNERVRRTGRFAGTAARKVVGVAKSGRLISLELTVSPVMQGKVVKSYVGFLRDMTAQDKLESERKMSREIASYSKQPIIVMSHCGVIETINRPALDLFGYPSEGHCVGQDVSILMPPEIGALHDGFVQTFLRGGRNKRAVDTIRTVQAMDSKGRLITIDIGVKELSVPGGEPKFLAFIHTVTDHLLRQESVAFNEALLSLAPMALVLSDATGRIILMTEMCCQLFGYGRNEVVNSSIKILMPAAVAAVHDTYLANYIHSGVKRIIGRDVRLTGVRRGGEPIEVTVEVKELIGKDGQRFFVALFKNSAYNDSLSLGSPQRSPPPLGK